MHKKKQLHPHTRQQKKNPLKITHPSVLLLHRIGEALQAAKRTHDTTNQESAGLAYNEGKVNDGIASLVELVQSISKDERKLDFEGAMDRLERESQG